MKYKNTVKYFLCALSAVAMLGSCAQQEFEEITEISLKRCLEPQDLYARVDIATGNQVTFGWDVNKDAEEFELVVYSDEERTTQAFQWTLSPGQVPFKAELVADNKYYFTVQAYKLDADGFPLESTLSNVAVYDGEVKTRAVADNLFPEVTARTTTSITLAWSKDLEDYLNVTHIEARPVRGGSTVKQDLKDAEKKAATATLEGLEASKEYQVTLCYYSASRGALDVWTMAEKGTLTAVSTSEELLTLVTDGGEAYLQLSGSPYTIGGSKPAAGVKLVGEIGADGEKPVVIGNFDIGSSIAANSSFYFEGVKFDDQLTHNHMFNYSGENVVLGDITLVNCEVTGYKAGLLYNNKAALTVGNMTFDSCDMYDNATTFSGDCIDIRKSTTIGNITFVNCTLYDTFRTLFRIDTPSDALQISLGDITFENNTVKAVAAWDHKDNRGLFAFRVKTNMSLKKNLFLYEDTGLKGMADEKTYNNKCQLFQVNDNTVIPDINAQDNYSFANGDAFFAKVSAQEAGCTILSEDPCFNSKGNNFYLANAELLDKKVGAYKWQLTYEEKVEDLTQNVVEAPHVWNFQDAKLFAGTAKNSRVRDELLIVATEETPVNLDGAVTFLSATPRTKKGVPAEGYIAFKVDQAGSVDILVTDPDRAGGTVSIALQDDNGFAVQGGAAASASNPSVQKVVIPKVTGEGTVYIFATAPAAVTKLAWSDDTKGGDKVLATPTITIEPVTLTAGDETAVTLTWTAVEHASYYQVKFNKKTREVEEGALTFVVPAEEIAALEAGLYNATVQAFPADGDLYYQESQVGTASIAVQPKAQEGGGGGAMVEKTIVWDFSSDTMQDWLKGIVATENTSADFDGTVEGLYVKSSSGKWRIKNGAYYLQTGQTSFDEETGAIKDHYFKFTAPAAGKLVVTAANTGGSNPARNVYVKVGDADPDHGGAFEGTTGKDFEFDISAAGEVTVYPGDGGLAFYKFVYTYEEFDPNAGGGEPAPEEDYVWDFSSDSIVAWLKSIVADENTGANFDGTIEGLYVKSSSGKWRIKNGAYYLQTGQTSFDEETGAIKDHYFKFTVNNPGKLTVKAANTGGSNPARNVYVKVGDADPDHGGAFEGTTGKDFEFSIAAGEVTVYPGDGGLAFYKIEFHAQ